MRVLAGLAGFFAIFTMLAGLGKAMAADGKTRAEKAAPSRRSTFVPMDFKKLFSAGPLSEPQPPSTLLPAGATSFTLTLRAATPTTCRYSIGADRPFDAMTPFDAKEASSTPRTLIRGLESDPGKVNDVYIRCAAAPEAALHLQYRCLPRVKPGYPRTGNLWGSGNYRSKGMAYASHIDLWLGATFSLEQVRELRRLNPNCLILNSINTVENNDVPDDYFLRDTTGSKIEVWPGAWRLNLTRPEVAEYQARYAYQKMLESGLRYDGCFFDNFMMSQSWQNHDIYGRPAQIDADGDGKADDPKKLDAAWRAGVFHELRTWRKLMPWALTTGHSQGYPTPEIGEIFNGQGVGFYTTDVIEGKKPFPWLWDYYLAWNKNTVKPAITFVESAVPDEIAYGYDYSPQEKMPPATLAFARDYYPYMRFGLTFTLMSDGYFGHEIGDTHHGQDWWYDELDYKLGAPLGEARPVAVGQVDGRELISNGGFEAGLEKEWSLWSNKAAGSEATVARDTVVKRNGAAAARITVSAIGQGRGQVEFTQRERALTAGKSYELRFWARADRARPITVTASKGSPGWDNYGLSEDVTLSDAWQEFRLVFEATRTAGDARIQFHCGAATGPVWLDDVRLSEHAPEIMRRDFERGVALLNPTRQIQQVAVGAGLARLKGDQAPRYQYILDDAGPEFRAAGPWRYVELNTPEWKALPPFYHAWNAACHKLTLTSGEGREAQWDLALRGPGTYTVQAWWPAAPEGSVTAVGGGWTRQAVYELVAGGKVLATKTLDQSVDGDQWHTIAENIKLSPADKPFVRVRAAAPGDLVADALHVFSAERYNDGSPASEVSLEPMDGIILQKTAVKE